MKELHTDRWVMRKILGLLRSHIVKTLFDVKLEPTIAYEYIRINYIITKR